MFSKQMTLLGMCLIILSTLPLPDVSSTPFNATVDLANLVPPVSSDAQQYQHSALEYHGDHVQGNPTTDIASYILRSYVIPTLTIVGLCANLVNLAWSGETSFNPTIFFFKALAVTDFFNCLGSFLLTNAWMWFVGIPAIVVIFMIMYINTVSAYLTTAVVFSHWYAVRKPRTMVTKRRVVGYYILLLIWTAMLLVPALLFWFSIFGTVIIVLPVAIVLILNVSLLCKLCEHRARSQVGQQQHDNTARSDVGQLLHDNTARSDVGQQQHDNTARSQVGQQQHDNTARSEVGQQQHDNTARAYRLQGFNSLDAVVVCMSVTTILAYPPPFIFIVFYMTGKSTQSQCGPWCLEVQVLVAALLVVFNASIKVLYYFLFSSRFRDLLRRRLCC